MSACRWLLNDIFPPHARRWALALSPWLLLVALWWRA